MPDRFGDPPVRPVASSSGLEPPPRAGGRITHGTEDQPIRRRHRMDDGERLMLHGFCLAGDEGVIPQVAALPFGKPYPPFVENGLIEEIPGSDRWRVTPTGRQAYQRGWFEIADSTAD